MRLTKLLICVLGLVLFVQGCATLKGAKEGLKEDWKALGKTDDWMREHLW